KSQLLSFPDDVLKGIVLTINGDYHGQEAVKILTPVTTSCPNHDSQAVSVVRAGYAILIRPGGYSKVAGHDAFENVGEADAPLLHTVRCMLRNPELAPGY